MERWRGSAIYAAVWLACAYPLIMLGLGFLASFGVPLFVEDLGANPIEALLRGLGDWALRFTLIGLAITPAAQILKRPALIRYRRTVGLWAFTYVCAHLLTYVTLDKFFDWGIIVEDIVSRPFITLGMTAFVLLIPLAITSTNALRRKLGPRRWKRLHQLVYPIAILGVIHYDLMVKADTREPLIYAAILALLLGYRVWRWTKTRKPPSKPKPKPQPA